MFQNLLKERDNSEIFRSKVKNFDNLVKYTYDVLNKKIVIEQARNGNIITDKICYHYPNANTFYITEIKYEGNENIGEVLFWEKEFDKFNYFSSAGKLSRLVRRLFNEISLSSENLRYNNKRIKSINDKIKGL